MEEVAYFSGEENTYHLLKSKDPKTMEEVFVKEEKIIDNLFDEYQNPLTHIKREIDETEQDEGSSGYISCSNILKDVKFEMATFEDFKNPSCSIQEELAEAIAGHPSHESQNPWPHLKDFYVFKSRDPRNVNVLHFHCVLCRPKKTTIRAHMSSLGNLKSHIRRNHKVHIIQFEDSIKAGSFRGKRRQTSFSCSRNMSQLLQPPTKKICQSTNGEAFGQLTTGTDIHQSVVDTRIVNFFICNMLPLHVVESPTFVSLIKTLNPSKTSMSCSTLGKRIMASHKQLEQYLTRLLKDISWVATTADCWSAHNKSYLEITAHWLDPKTRMRQHSVLAFSRLKGDPSCDNLSKAMEKTHCKFNLQDKVTRTTTDNGNNFVKTFVQFSTEVDLLPDIPEPVDSDAEGMKDGDLDVNPDTGVVDEVEYISVEAALEKSKDLSNNLPVHLRCAAHTFNLVASVDADKALDSASFKSAYRNTMSKAQTLWNQQSYNTVSADFILDELNRKLVVPNSSRWNSIYDSVIILNNLVEKKRVAVERVMTKLNMKVFCDSEVIFLKEYTQVMSSVARALDKILGKDQAYLGSLLPTVVAAIMKLKHAKSKGLQFCSPLVDAMLAGITKRFGALLQDQECQLAAAFHPKFRLFWLEKHDHSQLIKAKKAMETAVEGALRETIEESGSTTSEDEDDDFFSSITQPQVSRNHKSLKSKAQNLVKTWLEACSKDVLTDDAFLGEQVFIDLFIKYNTAIPSSATIEGLFSIERDILRVKRASLSDANFERLLFMKGNHHHMIHVQTLEEEQDTKPD